MSTISGRSTCSGRRKDQQFNAQNLADDSPTRTKAGPATDSQHIGCMLPCERIGSLAYNPVLYCRVALEGRLCGRFGLDSDIRAN